MAPPVQASNTGLSLGTLLGGNRIPLPAAVFMLEAYAELFAEPGSLKAFVRGFRKGMHQAGATDDNINAVVDAFKGERK